MHTLIIDDLAADRMLAHHCLTAAGWTTELARNSSAAWAVLERWRRAGTSGLILTDLHMPHDSFHRTTGTAGAWLALALREQMQRGTIPHLPIVALTALAEEDVHLTARAFGCDAVLIKPATPDLPQRIEEALARAADQTPAGTDAMLGLLRHTLAETLGGLAPRQITEQQLTRALLAYRRRGLVGLGESELAALLIPGESRPLRRGELALERMRAAIERALHLGLTDTATLLRGELLAEESPAVQSHTLGLSISEYYRRRREAIGTLLQLMLEPHSP